uniref:Viral late gene transcription factor 3 zinc ribbon domain-containing protein n=1 Tax=viral metagenome TaxID=1070528 RepID=A0A6C0BN21_9ZZZZ
MTRNGNFLDYVQHHRNQNLLQNQKRVQLEKEVSQLNEQLKQTSTIQERVAIKKQRLLIQRQLQNIHSIPLAEFDRKLIPFLNSCYNSQADGDLLIEQFDAEFHIASPEPSYVNANLESCSKCNLPYVHIASEAQLVCEACGQTERYIDTSVLTMAYGDEIEYSSFSYRRINHFRELLNYLQAKETTTVPQSALNTVMQYLVEKRYNKVTRVTFNVIRKALRDLGMRKYYDHAMQIWCLITGGKALRLDPRLEEKFTLMFIAIQQPWERHCPDDRKNFLSYPYCFYKLSQLLGQKDLLPYFTLLKCPKKRKAQEDLFELICQDLNWTFVPI